MVFKGVCTIRELVHLNMNVRFAPKWFPVVGFLLVYKRHYEPQAWPLNGRGFLNVMIITATVRILRNLALLHSKQCVAPCTSVV